MQGPHLIQRAWPVQDENDTGAATGAGASTSAASFAPSTQQVPQTSNRDGNRQPTQSTFPNRGESSALPLFEEAQVGGNVAVAVRLSSLYGAEWTQDHAKLHESGQCKCPVSFEKYKPIDTSADQGEIIDAN
jgi:hypothetical protein